MSTPIPVPGAQMPMGAPAASMGVPATGGSNIAAIAQDPAAREALARKLAMQADIDMLLAMGQGLGQGQAPGGGGMQVPQVGTPPAMGPTTPPQQDAIFQEYIKSMMQQSPNQDVLGQLLIGGNRGQPR